MTTKRSTYQTSGPAAPVSNVGFLPLVGPDNAMNDPAVYRYLNTLCINYRHPTRGIVQTEYTTTTTQSYLNEITAAPMAAGNPKGARFGPRDQPGTKHVVYRSVQDELIDLSWGGDWQVRNLSALGIGAIKGDPSIYSDSKTGFVVCRGTNDHIYQFANSGSWSVTDLTADSSAPLAGGNPDGFGGLRHHVTFRDGTGGIHALSISGGQWVHQDLTAMLQLPASLGDPHAFSFKGTPFLVFRANSEYPIWTLNRYVNPDRWEKNFRSFSTWAAPATDPIGYGEIDIAAHQLHVDVNGHVIHYGPVAAIQDLVGSASPAAEPSAGGVSAIDVSPWNYAVYRAADGSIKAIQYQN